MVRRKVQNGEKSPWGQCPTRPVPNGRRCSAFWLGRKTQKFSGTNQKPERPRQFGTGLVRHCTQGLFSPFFSFLRAIFSRQFRLSLAPTICSLGLRGCSWRRVSTKSIYRENIQRLGQEKRGCYRVKLSLQWVSVRNEGRELNKESRWSDWPSFHKLHQRAQVNNNLSSAKHLMLDFSRLIVMFRSNKSLG